QTRIIVTYFSYLWEPILKVSESFGLKRKGPLQNWLSHTDINNLLYLSGFDVYRTSRRMLLPVNIPVISGFFNKYLAKLPLFRFFSLNFYSFAKPLALSERDQGEQHSVSVVIPARNESGNIRNAIQRLPKFGRSVEIIFIEGNSTDDTWSVITEVQ